MFIKKANINIKKPRVLTVLVITATLTVSVAGLGIVSMRAVKADTTPEACFGFDSGIGTIIDYYDHENNDSNQPACPKDVVIPSQISSTPVTAIGKNVYAIGNNGFKFKQITSVTIPSSVTSIGKDAFLGNLLTFVNIPNSVTHIGNMAFSGNQMSTLTIPSSVTTIDPGAFAFNQLDSVTIEGTPNLSFSIVDYNIFAANGADLIQYVSLYSSDPAAAIAYLDSHIRYVPIYTSDPSNPAGYTDTDYGNKFTTTFNVPIPTGANAFLSGGVIINPSQVTVNYHDTNSNPVDAPDYFVGPSLSDYKISSNPSANFSLYYHADDTATLTAPDTISNYSRQSQSPYSLPLLAGPNSHTFIYVIPNNNPVSQSTNNNQTIQSLTTISASKPKYRAPNSGLERNSMTVPIIVLLAGISAVIIFFTQVLEISLESKKKDPSD